MGSEPAGGSARWETMLDSELPSVDLAESAVLALAQRAGFEEDDLHKIGIALREAVVNAVVHGNRYHSQKKVFLAAWQEEGALHVVVRDEGPGFELAAVPDPLAEENLLKESGRGILLMQAFMDEFQVRRLPVGTEVTLVKFLPES